MTKAMDIYRMSNLEEVFELIDPLQDLAFDTETIGKYGEIRLVQFYQRHWEQALIIERPDPIQLLIKFNSIKQCNIVMQYAAYDISTIQEQTGSRWIPETFSDTFFLARLAFPHLDKYSLDHLIHYAIGRDPYAEAGINKAEMQDHTKWGNLILEPNQYLYASLDVYYLFDLYDKIKEQSKALCYKLDINALRCALDFQRNGFPVDKERLMKQYKVNMDKIADIALPINCNSWQQVRPYIGSDQSDALGLARLTLQGNERAAAVNKARKLVKQNSFINKFDTPDGNIYGHFVPSTRAGRFSCSDQNLEQLPRALKHCFGYTPEDNKVMIYSDYPGLQLRCVAAITGDPVLLKLFYNNVDIHNYVAEMIFGNSFTKTQRQITKTCNFNLLFGGGWAMLQGILIKDAGIWLEEYDIKKLIRQWKGLFKGIADWQESGIRDHRRKALGSTPFGRRYKGRLITDQLNIEIQGFESEIAKLAMQRMYPEFSSLLFKTNDIQLINFIHDSFHFCSDNVEEAYVKASKLLGDTMHQAWLDAVKAVDIQDIPMPVNVYVGYNWGDIEDGDYFHEYKITA